MLTLKKFFRFIIVGITSTAINFSVFSLFQFLSYSLFVSSIFGYSVGIINSYIWGSKWVHFKVYRIEIGLFSKFFFLYGFNGIVVSWIIQAVQLEYGFDPRVCWLIGTAYGVIANFSGQKLIIFNDNDTVKKMHSQSNKKSSFGLLGKLEFLQNFASYLIAIINPAVTHNLEKYKALKKIFYLSAIEDIEGEYLEFGIYTGSSFCHSIRCAKQLVKINPEIEKMKFFGFDSFDGFGDVSDDEKHPFYKDQNFSTDMDKVEKRVLKIAKAENFQIIPGFFEESLKPGPAFYGIEKSRIIFVDSDTYSSAKAALKFSVSTIQNGTFIVLDDFYSYKGDQTLGVAGAFNEFIKENNFFARRVLDYAMGGVAFVLHKRGVK